MGKKSKRQKREERQQAKRKKQLDRAANAAQKSDSDRNPWHLIDPDEINKFTIGFSFSGFDSKWYWGSIRNQHPCVLEVMAKLGSFSNMTWNDVYADRKIGHQVPVQSMCPEAAKRLDQISNDYDELWELLIDGGGRLWGWKDGLYFYALWWDPDHQVYPMDITANKGGAPTAKCGNWPAT